MNISNIVLPSLSLKVLLASVATFTVIKIWRILTFWTWSYSSPLRDIPGPKRTSLLLGNLEEIRRSESSVLHEEWVKKYGKVVVYKGFMNMDRIYTMDTRALNHVLTHSIDYQKPYEAREGLSRLLGDGILVTEGEKHRQQRRVMNPSFGPPSIRNLTPIFFQKAQQLRDIWADQLPESGGSRRIEVLSWLSRATLDIIGLAGFNYRFDSLNVNEKPTDLNLAFQTLFRADADLSPLLILQIFIPILREIPTHRRRQEIKAKAAMRRIAKELVDERKKAFTNEKKDIEKDSDNLNENDLLSVLIKANMDPDIPESQRMTDEDVLSQIPTFLVAGHETTSVETMWCLYALSKRPDLQARLREELLSVPTDTPSMDELQALPFLDAVVRETLRVHPAVPATSRVAKKDDIIPLNEPFVDKHGKLRSEIPIRKGESFFIPIVAINRWSEIWGADALEFNPDRWANIPESTTSIPGVFANLLSFLGGPRSCIGYRFALVEMKALLFTLIRSFEFELGIPDAELEKRSTVVTRPYLKSEKRGKAQMPLLVKAYVPA
ncbi:cytochrome P450 [Schizopora paradoxa]|uniref:Cytochrome P450 n=1 Tax=Schizopora paradoxa TaxID=27342 RepID=A0A0H2RP40_9AGAM|nr:cytochrome P450 [Schizopora paradoxa]